jgi:NAD(P)-dependent dehydrogenase (short-subunit alcohol dehydrogenase family)
MLPTVLITGANRGIGLALTRVLLKAGGARKVYAVCRRPGEAAALRELAGEYAGVLAIVALDVRDGETCRATAAAVAGKASALDILINNAAYGGVKDGTLEGLDLEATLDLLNINTVGPARVTQAMLGLLRASAKAGGEPRVVNISSGLGSVSGCRSCESLAYGTSKAALNYLTRSMAWDLKKDGIIVAAVSPGWVRTDMGGPNATLSPEQSAEGIAKVAASLTPADTGCWFNWDGSRNDLW